MGRMVQNPYRSPCTCPTSAALLRFREIMVVLAIGLPITLYGVGYFVTDIAPMYPIRSGGSETLRLYRTQVEAIAFIPAGKVEALLTGRQVNVESADGFGYSMQ
jgi:hypothetical protein